jgi:hypothetical protein
MNANQLYSHIMHRESAGGQVIIQGYSGIKYTLLGQVREITINGDHLDVSIAWSAKKTGHDSWCFTSGETKTFKVHPTHATVGDIESRGCEITTPEIGLKFLGSYRTVPLRNIEGLPSYIA